MRRAFALVAMVAGLAVVSSAPETLHSSATFPKGTYLIGMRQGVDPRDVINSMGLSGEILGVSDDGFLLDAGSSEVSSLAADPALAHIVGDTTSRIQGTQITGPGGYPSPNDVVPWGLDVLDSRTGARDGSFTWNDANAGSGVKVYVIDTGVQTNHPAFTNVASGWSYRSKLGANNTPDDTAFNDYASAMSAGKIPACASDPQNQQYAPASFDGVYDATDTGSPDNNGHGTHVAGIVAGTLTGVAKSATIVPVRALDSCGNGTPTMVLEALKWIVADHPAGQKAVVNMSLGIDNPRDATRTEFQTQINKLLAEGVVVTAASGNAGQSACNSIPASTNGAISVGAVGVALDEARFSDYGTCVDIFAPGGSLNSNGTYTIGKGILSTWPKRSGVLNTYVEELGTSMSAPFVSGAVAQYLSGVAWSTSNPNDAFSYLQKNSTCGLVSYYDSSRASQTPNRMVYTGSTPVAPCAPTGITKTQESGRSVIAWAAVPSGNGSDVTGYQVTTMPATTGCTTNASTYTCALTGLVDGTRYTVSVQAVNGVGAGTAGTLSLVAGATGVESTTTTVAPTTTTTVAPTTTTTEAPTTTTTLPPAPSTTLPAVESTPANPVTAVSSSKSLLLTWPAVTSAEAVTYVVSVTPGGVSCTTSNTSCTFIGVSLGTVYNFSIIARTASGQSSVALRYTVTAGINQKNTTVTKASRTSLSSIVTSLSKGKRTYKVTSGKCTISTGRLLAPKVTGVCKVKVSIAKYRTYKAMSAVLTIHVV